MLLSFAIVLTTLVQAPGPPTALDPSVEQAARQAEQGLFTEAVRTLEDAHRERPRPFLLYNVGQLHRARGDCAAARAAYARYLAETTTDDPDRGKAERRLTEMDACLATASPPTATSPTAAASPPPATSPTIAGPLSPRAPPTATEPSVALTATGRGWTERRVAGWAAVGTGAVAGVAAAVFAVNGWRARRSLDREAQEGTAWDASKQGLQDQVESNRQRAIWFGLGAVVAGGAGALVLRF